MSFCCHHDDSHIGREELSVLSAIDLPRVVCYNEQSSGSGRLVFKAECSRVDKSQSMSSAGDDPEMLLSIPFTSNLRIRALCVSCGDAPGTCPARVRVYANCEGLDFSGLDTAPLVQEVPLTGPDASAELWHPLKVVKLGNVSHLHLHFSGRLGVPEEEQGEGSTRVFYVGLKAEVVAPKLGVVHAVYESRAQLSDHKNSEHTGGGGVNLKL